MVQVAALRGTGAPREHTGQVPLGRLCGEPVGDLVLLDVHVFAQVDHRPHGHRGAGVAAPGADLVGVHERAGVRHPGQVQLLLGLGGGAGDRVFGEVDVQHDLPPLVGGVGGGVEVEGELAPGHLPERLGAAHVQRGGGAEVGQPGRHRAERAVSRSRASARSTSASTHTVPSKDTWPVCTWTCRASAAASRRRRASAGMCRMIASWTSRSTPVGRIRCANGATWSSTNPAAAGESPMVWRAIRRARHAGRSPASTRAQVRGSRCRSSRASPR